MAGTGRETAVGVVYMAGLRGSSPGVSCCSNTAEVRDDGVLVNLGAVSPEIKELRFTEEGREDGAVEEGSLFSSGLWLLL